MSDVFKSELRSSEEWLRKDQNSMASMGGAIANELVKSYGFNRNAETGEWDWSFDNIVKQFKDHPIWTSIDYLSIIAPPAKFGLAAAGIVRGAEAAGAVGKAYQALKGAGTAEELATATAAFTGKKATTWLGKAAKSTGLLSDELITATEMKVAGPSQLHGVRIPFTQRTIGLANPITTEVTDDYIRLVDKFGGELWEKRAIASSYQRERLMGEAMVGRQAEITARKLSRAGLDEAGNEQMMRLLSTRVAPEELESVVAREFGDNKKAAAAYKATWGFRNTIHQRSYELGLIDKATYEANLYKWNPRTYEEYEQIQKDLGILKPRTTKLPESRAGAAPVEVPEGAESSSRIVQGGAASLQSRKSVEAVENLTQILDPRISLGRMAQVGQLHMRQRYAQAIAKSVLATDAEKMIPIVEDIVNNGNKTRALLHGLSSEKFDAAQRLVKNLSATNREATGAQMADLLGWKKVDALFEGKDLPKYVQNLPEEFRNKYLDPAAARDVMGTMKFLADGDDDHLIGFVRQFHKNALSTFRASKTAYNPGTHIRNLIGAAIFSHLATGGVPHLVPLRGLAELGKEDSQWVKWGLESGTLGTSYDTEIYKDITKAANPDAKSALDWLPDNVVTGWIKKAANGAERVYRATDEVYKLDAWIRLTEKHLAKLEKDGLNLSPDALHELARSKATIDVNKFMPNFTMQSELADTLRKGIPFSSFTSESMRVWKNVITEKPHLAFFWNHAMKSTSEIFGAMAGYSPDQIEEAEQSLPSFVQGKKSLLLPFNVDGQPQFVDMSYVIPLGSIVNAEKSERFFLNDIYDIGANPVINVGAAVLTGKDPFSGREIGPNFTERQLGIPVQNQQARTAIGLGEHMLQMFLPPWTPPGYAGTNILESIRGQVNPSTNQPLEGGVLKTVLANLGGFRTYAPDVEAQVRNLQEDQRKIGDQLSQSWKRWEFARANGKVGAMESERNNILALKTREGADDPEGYFGQSIKTREPFGNLSTKQLEKILTKAEKLGALSPHDEKIRAELLARYQSRKQPKAKAPPKEAAN